MRVLLFTLASSLTIFLSCSGLDREKAKGIKNWIENQAASSGPKPAITKEGKYMSSVYFRYIEKIENGETFNTLDSQKGEKLKELKSLLGSSLVYGIEVVDISYDSLKRYYNKHFKDRRLTYTENGKLASDEGDSMPEKLKEFFDKHEADGNKLVDLSLSYLFDLSSFNEYQINNSENFKRIFKEVLESMVNTESGKKRLKSLLLLKLLTFIKDNKLEISSETIALNGKIVVLDGKAADIECCVTSNGLIYNIMEAIDLTSFALATNQRSPQKVRDQLEALRKEVKPFSESNYIRPEIVREICGPLACSLLHELTHIYDCALLGFLDIKTGKEEFDGAYLTNKQLTIRIIPLLANARLEKRVKTVISKDKELRKYLKNPYNKVNKIDELVNREFAREICSNDDPNDMLAIQGILPIHIKEDEFIAVTDYTNENSIRKELNQPLVYGHYRFRLDGSDEDTVNAYQPFELKITIDEGKEKTFEPYILENAINCALGELSINELINAERRSIQEKRAEIEVMNAKKIRKIEKEEKRRGHRDYQARGKQRYLERKNARQIKSNGNDVFTDIE